MNKVAIEAYRKFQIKKRHTPTNIKRNYKIKRQTKQDAGKENMKKDVRNGCRLILIYKQNRYKNHLPARGKMLQRKNRERDIEQKEKRTIFDQTSNERREIDRSQF